MPEGEPVLGNFLGGRVRRLRRGQHALQLCHAFTCVRVRACAREHARGGKGEKTKNNSTPGIVTVTVN